MSQMTTLSQVMETLRERGIDQELRMNEQGEMRFENSDKIYLPSELIILKTYRFEGDSSPDDNVALYVIKDSIGNRGMIIDSYGAESNYPGDQFDTFLRDIPVEEIDDDSF
ncbi:hypothetical protein JI747_008760 [Chryseobacterium sp. RG1]|uniref:Phosphoribosylpyrophosphate synthetase n=1 Tax=Chryseobacterium tagetis TaxID=2801334 RepID=A0ABS7ZZV7_9FLAO|nr:hypothetical protein [Chryseobacterium tagetis]MCA6067264.1 hypothetical protein [Chryseobacterium tagetis]